MAPNQGLKGHAFQMLANRFSIEAHPRLADFLPVIFLYFPRAFACEHNHGFLLLYSLSAHRKGIIHEALTNQSSGISNLLPFDGRHASFIRLIYSSWRSIVFDSPRRTGWRIKNSQPGMGFGYSFSTLALAFPFLPFWFPLGTRFGGGSGL